MNKQKKYYTVKVEAIAPIELTFRILAEDADEALHILEKRGLENQLLEPPKPKLTRLRKLSAKVYDIGTIILRKSKNYQ